MAQYPSTYTTAINVLKMLRVLESRRRREMKIRDLAERIGVSTRTIKRYIDFIGKQFINFDDNQPMIKREKRGNEIWAILTSKSTLSASLYRYASVYAATSHLLAVKEPILSDTAGGVLETMKKELPDQTLKLLKRVETGFYYVPFGAKNYQGAEESLDTIVQALIYRRPLKFLYCPFSGGEHPRKLEPYTLVMYKDGLYVLGARKKDSRKEMRIYAVDRIREVELVRGKNFNIPRKFSPDTYFAGTFGLWKSRREPRSIEIIFDENIVAAIEERKWAGMTSMTRLPDGKIQMKLNLAVTPEVINWIVSWGSKAKVIAPESLRQQMKDFFEGALKNYQ